MDYRRYKIGTDPDMNWFVYRESGPWDDGNFLSGIPIVLDQVRQVFEDCFGVERVHQFHALAVMHTHGAPMTYRDNGLIFIQAAQCHWQQYIYQFAHELCHFMIPSSPISELRWFEEALCETASLFTLTKIYEIWSASDLTPPITNPAFTATFPAYIASEQASATALGDLSVPAFITSHLAELAENFYLREHNCTIANAILPLFLEYPSTWSAIPSLCEVCSCRSFRESLLSWKDLCPQNAAVQIDHIANLLTTPQAP